MREDYKLQGKTSKLSGIELEKDVAEALEAMQKHTTMSASEIANTALKRFISQHRDFLPPDYPRSGERKS
jgi:hypothetical protein